MASKAWTEHVAAEAQKEFASTAKGIIEYLKEMHPKLLEMDVRLISIEKELKRIVPASKSQRGGD